MRLFVAVLFLIVEKSFDLVGGSFFEFVRFFDYLRNPREAVDLGVDIVDQLLFDMVHAVTQLLLHGVVFSLELLLVEIDDGDQFTHAVLLYQRIAH